MEYTGLSRKYTVDRALTEQERNSQLKQKQKTGIEPVYQLSVIQLNSTYLELVDKYFAWKGLLTSTMLAGWLIVGGGGLVGTAKIAIDALATPPGEDPPWIFVVLFLAIITMFTAFAIWLLRMESFAFTHYPMRFNRKSRMVHVFRLDGTVLSVPWDKVFFCLGALPQRGWEIQGHVLGDDGLTVNETFALSMWGIGAVDRSKLVHFWEFVRGYMEDGPKQAHALVKYCLPIAGRRERPMDGFYRMHAEAGTNIVFVLLLGALALILMPGRWFSMRTSKVPAWPQEVEDQCRIEPGDPYVRDASNNTV